MNEKAKQIPPGEDFWEKVGKGAAGLSSPPQRRGPPVLPPLSPLRGCDSGHTRSLELGGSPQPSRPSLSSPGEWRLRWKCRLADGWHDLVVLVPTEHFKNTK